MLVEDLPGLCEHPWVLAAPTNLTLRSWLCGLH